MKQRRPPATKPAARKPDRDLERLGQHLDRLEQDLAKTTRRLDALISQVGGAVGLTYQDPEGDT